MQDRPDPDELTLAVLDFLQNEIFPAVEDPRLRFRTRVAINGLGILARQLESEEPMLRRELERLCALLGEPVADVASSPALREELRRLNAELSRRIRAGEAPEGTLATVTETVDDKLRIASPRTLERYQ